MRFDPHAAVVYLDETSWRVSAEKMSLWALASSLQRVFWFGCNKDDETLDELLPPEIFAGIGVSDDAGVIAACFRRAQKCWGAFAAQDDPPGIAVPAQCSYRRFWTSCCNCIAMLSMPPKTAALANRAAKSAAQLEDRLCQLCVPFDREATAEMKPYEKEFANLIQELLRLMLAEELFTFVLEPEVESTNNGMERPLRGQALDRKAGRINQTPAGAYRRSVIVSVLELLCES